MFSVSYLRLSIVLRTAGRLPAQSLAQEFHGSKFPLIYVSLFKIEITILK